MLQETLTKMVEVSASHRLILHVQDCPSTSVRHQDHRHMIFVVPRWYECRAEMLTSSKSQCLSQTSITSDWPWTVDAISMPEDEALFLEEVIVPAKQCGLWTDDHHDSSNISSPAISVLQFRDRWIADHLPGPRWNPQCCPVCLCAKCENLWVGDGIIICHHSFSACQSAAQVTGQDTSTPSSGSSGLLLCKATGHKNLFKELQTRCHGFGGEVAKKLWS